mmetsp:Transcript_51840/g.160855  ORF Transcript_51840/g.160855 Transcript_51840/m.160855 type:complete len:390 (-) Transcript_51840:528-1697(-)
MQGNARVCCELLRDRGRRKAEGGEGAGAPEDHGAGVVPGHQGGQRVPQGPLRRPAPAPQPGRRLPEGPARRLSGRGDLGARRGVRREHRKVPAGSRACQGRRHRLHDPPAVREGFRRLRPPPAALGRPCGLLRQGRQRRRALPLARHAGPRAREPCRLLPRCRERGLHGQGARGEGAERLVVDRERAGRERRFRGQGRLRAEASETLRRGRRALQADARPRGPRPDRLPQPHCLLPGCVQLLLRRVPEVARPRAVAGLQPHLADDLAHGRALVHGARRVPRLQHRVRGRAARGQGRHVPPRVLRRGAAAGADPARGGPERLGHRLQRLRAGPVERQRLLRGAPGALTLALWLRVFRAARRGRLRQPADRDVPGHQPVVCELPLRRLPRP